MSDAGTARPDTTLAQRSTLADGGVVGLWAAIHQQRLKRASMTFVFVGSICLILIAPGLVLTNLTGDAYLIRAFVLRILFMLLYLSWGITAIHHLREWRRTIQSVVNTNGQ